MSSLFIKQISIGPMMNFVYLVGPAGGEEAVAIDVAWDADKIIREAKGANRRIVGILLTHTHYDHCNAVGDFLQKLMVPVYVHQKEADQLPPTFQVSKTNDTTKMEIGGLKIECWHTPGHTPGSQCFLINKAIFTGDTLFVGNCGRVDLPGSNPQEMDESLKRLASLPDEIVVYPGHDYGSQPISTIGQEKKSNYYMLNGVLA